MMLTLDLGEKMYFSNNLVLVGSSILEQPNSLFLNKVGIN